MYSQKRNCAAPSIYFHIYIFLGSVHIFSCSWIGRPILGIKKSLADTWILTGAAQFPFWEYLFRIFAIVSLQCRSFFLLSVVSLLVCCTGNPAVLWRRQNPNLLWVKLILKVTHLVQKLFTSRTEERWMDVPRKVISHLYSPSSVVTTGEILSFASLHIHSFTVFLQVHSFKH